MGPSFLGSFSPEKTTVWILHTVHSSSANWLRSAWTSLAVSPLLTVPNDVSGIWLLIPIAQIGPEAVEIRVLKLSSFTGGDTACLLKPIRSGAACG